MTLDTRKLEDVAMRAGLHLSSNDRPWSYNADHPHIAEFDYRIDAIDESTEELRHLGTANGYRITQDWSVEHALELWHEADALDGDVLRYVDALIRELRACEHLFALAPALNTAQRTTILRHVEAQDGVDSSWLVQATAASLAVMDAPVLMLVDPRKMPNERRSPAARLQGRSHTATLLDIGFVRMVGSRLVWGWNRELGDGLMQGYSYEKLLEARRSGMLDTQLKARLMEEVYGDVPEYVARMVDLPEPDETDEED